MAEPFFNWSDAAISRLKELAEQGYSSSQIANELGAPSRNSVIGKAAREGISLKVPAKSSAGGRKPSEPKTKKPRSYGTLPPILPRPIIEAPAPAPVIDERKYKANEPLPGSRMLDIMQLRSNSCRWPLGDPRAPDFAYCGADAAIGRSYCPCHHRMAYASQIEPYVKPAPAPKLSIVSVFKAAIAAEITGAAS